MEQAEYKRRERAAARSISQRPCADPKRRKRLEKNVEKWLKWYKPDVYYMPFCDVHRKIIKAALRSLKQGLGMVAAAPRGFGKSSLLGDIALFGVLTGLCSFPVVIGWQQRAGKKMLRGWLADLSENERIAADYGEMGDQPDVCGPFQVTTQGKAIRNLTWQDGEMCGADIQLTDGYIVLPGCKVLMAGSVKGSLRGVRAQVDGRWVRPDVAFLDDPQDKPTAQSETLTNQVLERIDYDIMSLSGPNTRIALMAAVTVIDEDDVADSLLKRRDLEAIRMGQVSKWPAGWDDHKSEIRILWEEWNVERLDGMQEDSDGGKRARAFYRKNKAKMKRGFAVSWKDRKDKERGDPDALYAAMWDFYRLGENAFMAERQNQPVKQGATVYTLTPKLVMSRIDQKRDVLIAGEGFDTVIVATDINHYGLHSVAVAFSGDQSSQVIWYKRFDDITVPENAPEAERNRIVFEMLAVHGREVDSLFARANLWIIDGGYAHDVVQRYVKGRTKLPATVVARGYGADRYKPWGKNVIGKAREQSHMTKWPMGKGIAWNEHYWQEIAQRSWLGSVGAPGACSLFPGRHRDFAEQVTNERLMEKLEGKYGTVWRWRRKPGRNDYGDSFTMCFVGAAFFAINTAGADTEQPKQRRGRRVRHIGV